MKDRSPDGIAQEHSLQIWTRQIRHATCVASHIRLARAQVLNYGVNVLLLQIGRLNRRHLALAVEDYFSYLFVCGGRCPSLEVDSSSDGGTSLRGDSPAASDSRQRTDARGKQD